MSKKVLIVDDSALVRKQLKELISTLDFEISIAKNGKEAVDMAIAEQFDVITMDVNMPVMDGLTAVKEIMEARPTAILMVSSLTSADATTTMDALDLGAIDFIAKPGTMNIGKNENSEEILQKVTSLSRIPKRRLQPSTRRRTPAPRRERPARTERDNTLTVKTSSLDVKKVVLIGSSTGGPGLIEQICAALPESYPYPVCIVQHMPAQFTAAFATRLDRVSALQVQESSNNMELLPGNIYVAKGGTHLHFAKKVSGKIVLREDTGREKRFFMPSVDEMVFSALDIFEPRQIIGAILTGIGDDGAAAFVKAKKGGAYTLGESEESCTVYGMPRVAFENGGISEQLPFNKILKTLATLK